MRCKHWCRVPLDLVQEARQKAQTGCVDTAAPCQLSTHECEEHYGLLAEIDEYGTALWLRWQGAVTDMVVLQDCPASSAGPDGQGCCLFTGHPGQHTWEGAREAVSRLI